MERISGTAVKNIIGSLQGKEFDEERAAEIAEEVITLAAAVERATSGVGYEREPLHFRCVMLGHTEE